MAEEMARAWELAHKAVRNLIVGSGSIQDRLYKSYVEIAGAPEEGLTVERDREELRDIIRVCTKGNPTSVYTDHVQATIFSMSDNEAAEIAARIFSLFLSIEKENTRRDILDSLNLGEEPSLSM